jgi:hypothetical protein
MKQVSTCLATALALLCATGAHAQTTGSLTMNSEPGDYIGGGQPWSYDDTTAALSTSSDGSLVTVSVFANNGDWWYVNLAAPPGETLAVGAYENAVRASFRPAGSPGIDVYGVGRGCNWTHGRFDVHELTFGPHNYVISLSASFEQHCESPDAPALYGEIHVQNPPPPPALALSFTTTQASVDKVTGAAHVKGNLACNRAADVSLSLTLTQRISRTEVMRGWVSMGQICAAPGAAIETVVTESSGRAFVKGRPVEIVANASAFDPAYGSTVNATSTAVVKLK